MSEAMWNKLSAKRSQACVSSNKSPHKLQENLISVLTSIEYLDFGERLKSMSCKLFSVIWQYDLCYDPLSPLMSISLHLSFIPNKIPQAKMQNLKLLANLSFFSLRVKRAWHDFRKIYINHFIYSPCLFPCLPSTPRDKLINTKPIKIKTER